MLKVKYKYRCEICRNRYIRQDNLRRHHIREHPNDPMSEFTEVTSFEPSSLDHVPESHPTSEHKDFSMKETPKVLMFRITSPAKAPLVEQIDKVKSINVPEQTSKSEIPMSLANSNPLDPRLRRHQTPLVSQKGHAQLEPSSNTVPAYGANGELKSLPMPTTEETNQPSTLPSQPNPNQPAHYYTQSYPHHPPTSSYPTPRPITH